MQKRTEVKIYLIDEVCDVCTEGVYLPTGNVVSTTPMMYVHECTKCGSEKRFSCKYPQRVEEAIVTI